MWTPNVFLNNFEIFADKTVFVNCNLQFEMDFCDVTIDL